MPEILIPRGMDHSQFNKYYRLIKALALDEALPGMKIETLKGRVQHQKMYSARLNESDRLLFSKSEEGHIVLRKAADGHAYKSGLRQLAASQAPTVFDEYPCPEEDALDETALLQALEASISSSPIYEPIYCHHQQFIQWDDDQQTILQMPSRVILHGPPGVGKTVVAAKLSHNYMENPVRDENDRPLGLLYLAPTQQLVDEAQRNHQEMHDVFMATPEPVSATFMTYSDFFKQAHPQPIAEQQKSWVSFEDFNHWYTHFNHGGYRDDIAQFSAGNCWAAFRICSLYRNSADYVALGDAQCGIAHDKRAALHRIYQRYTTHCEQEGKYSEWVTPFRSATTFGLVVAEESQTQSGAMMASVFSAGHRFVGIVGGHQKMDAPTTADGYGLATVDLLALHLHHSTPFTTHYLTKAHRSSKKVTEVVNWFIAQKKSAGLHALSKGADGGLRGGLSEEGEASLVISSSALEGMRALQKRFSHHAKAIVITTEELKDTAKDLFPGTAVLTPNDAIGLEYDYVIAYNLVEALDGGLLGDVVDSEAASVTHRGKTVPEAKTLTLESPFNACITAISRAKMGLHMVEAAVPHRMQAFFQALAHVCSSENQPQKNAAFAASSPEEWFEAASKLFERGHGTEALRLIKENVPERYHQFITKYPIASQPEETKQETASVAVASSPSLTFFTATPKTPKQTSSTPSIVSKPKPLPLEHYIDRLWASFNIQDLTEVLLHCDVEQLLFQKHSGSKQCLVNRFAQQENRTIFMQICAYNGSILQKIPFKTIEAKLKKKLHKTNHSFFPVIQKLIRDISLLNSVYYTKSELRANQGKAALLTQPLVAAVFDNVSFITLLHEYQIDFNQPLARSEETIFHIASYEGAIDILRHFNMLGYDISQSRDHNIATIAFSAARGGHTKILFLLKKINERYDFNQVDKAGRMLPYIATLNRDIKTLQALKMLGVDIKTASPDGLSILHIAASEGDVQFMEQILKLVPDFNLEHTTQYGLTPAFAAAQFGSVDILRELQKRGADLDRSTPLGETPLFVAARSGHLATVKYLIEQNCAINSIAIATINGVISFIKERLKTGVEPAIKRLYEIKQALGAKDEKIPLRPIDIAQIMGHEAIVDLLRTSLVQEKPPVIIVQDNAAAVRSKVLEEERGSSLLF